MGMKDMLQLDLFDELESEEEVVYMTEKEFIDKAKESRKKQGLKEEPATATVDPVFEITEE